MEDGAIGLVVVFGSLLWRIWMLSSLPPTARSLHSTNQCGIEQVTLKGENFCEVFWHKLWGGVCHRVLEFRNLTKVSP